MEAKRAVRKICSIGVSSILFCRDVKHCGTFPNIRAFGAIGEIGSSAFLE
jgi:hypothetical protein